MRVLAAITKQTLRACIRSKIVIFLLALNLLAVFGLPLTVRGDGTAAAEIQVALTYSLRTVTVLVSLATIWIGCAGLSREIEAYNLHLVLTKPAPRWLVWLGKWLGVFIMGATVFILSSAVIYGLVLYQFNTGELEAEERRQVENEILVGRRIYLPDKPDFDRIAGEEYDRRLAAGEFAAEHDPGALIAEIKRQRQAASTGLAARQAKGWAFDGMRSLKAEARVFLRYRFYVGSRKLENQRQSVGRWTVINPDAPSRDDGTATSLPMQVMSGAFQEFSFPARLMSPKGRVILAYENLDPEGESVVFQPDDGPMLLVRATGFSENWLRGTLVGLMRLALLAAIGCVFGALFSPPVAIFVAFAYLLLGAILDPELGAPNRDFAGNIVAWQVKDMFSYSTVKVVQLLVVSFRHFDVTHALARGYLISGAMIIRLAVMQLLLRGAPLVALGIWIFGKRELGKVIRR